MQWKEAPGIRSRVFSFCLTYVKWYNRVVICDERNDFKR
jgi:hypothetical protein